MYDVLGISLKNVTITLIKKDESKGYYFNFNQSITESIENGEYYILISKKFFHPKEAEITISGNTIINSFLEFNETLEYDKQLIDYQTERQARLAIYVGVFLAIFVSICILVAFWVYRGFSS